MNPTIILDSSALIWLEKLNFLTQQRAHLPADRLPYHYFDTLLEKGCTLVIPQEVLKEMVSAQDGTCVGIGMNPLGKTFFPNHTLAAGSKYESHAVFNKWLYGHLHSGDVDMFPTSDHFLAAREQAMTKGHICIVATKPPSGTNHYKSYSPGAGAGDEEIKSIVGKIAADKMSDRVMLFTHDERLGTAVKAADPYRFTIANGSNLIHMASLSGLPQAVVFAEMNTKLTRHADMSLSDPIRDHIIEATMKEWGLVPTQKATPQPASGKLAKYAGLGLRLTTSTGAAK